MGMACRRARHVVVVTDLSNPGTARTTWGAWYDCCWASLLWWAMQAFPLATHLGAPAEGNTAVHLVVG